MGIPALPGQPTGPWIDGYRVRPFEYPRIRDSLEHVVAAINSGFIPPLTGIVEPGFEAFVPGDKPWLWQAGKKALHYNVPPSPGLRQRAEVAAHWKQHPPPADPYVLFLNATAGTTPAQAVDLIFQGKFDWWNRTWMFCDHVLSALLVEALLFALRRRPGNQEAKFNALTGDYIQLDAHVDAGDLGTLMSDGDGDKYFENAPVSLSELQIGDQLIFFNSFLHKYMVRDEWRLENALIVDITSESMNVDAGTNEFRGGVVRDQLTLQGHGIPPKRYPDYQDELVRALERELARLRATVVQKNNAGIRAFAHFITGATILRWEPFETFNDPGAWWIGIPVDAERRWTTPAKIKDDIPLCITAQDVTGQPVNPFPPVIANTAALFPLYEPDVSGTTNRWKTYLEKRGANDSTFVVASTLLPVRASGDLVPGIFRGGEERAIPVVRPRPVSNE